MVQNEHKNDLAHYRKRMRFTQVEAARLLGWKNTKGLIQLEASRATPTLVTAFKLSIIYRVPVEFLFKSLYDHLRQIIRAREAAPVPAGQRSLPLTYSSRP